MLSTSLTDAINEQIAFEMNSAYIYLGMSAYCESRNLPGFAKWLRLQWQEEVAHGMKLYDMVFARGGKVTLQGIDKPSVKYSSVLDVFKQVLAHEKKVTASINKLYSLASKENDYATQVALQWFISEQVEEEKNAGDIIAAIELVGDSGTALYMLDKQMGSRAAD
ncbi:MAG: ftnA 1 [Bacteroidetes bacterium]|nr:ftnA 1 [Bacteroidota bacterium]